MSREKRRVLGIGVAVRDVTVFLDHYPAADEKLPAEGFSETGGGPVTTALVTLSRMGVPSAFLGVVGNDAGGRFVRDDLTREGVDCTGLELRTGFETPTSVILVAGPARTICEWRQESLPLGREAFQAVPAAGIDALLVDGRMPELQVEAARHVRSGGGFVVLDAGKPRPGVEALLPVTDVAVLSHDYPKQLPVPVESEAFLEDLAERLPADGRRIAGLTLGEGGCLIKVGDDTPVLVPGFAVEAIDTTGAGDVFHGALTAALLAGDAPLAAARFANAAAALKCRGRTGRAPIPGYREVREFAGL